MPDSSERELGHLQAACPSLQGSVSPADLLLTPLPGLTLWFPQKRQQSGQELRLPSSTAKTFWDSVTPALLSPPHTCKPPETHTCTHTRVPFPHCPPLPTSCRFPCSPPTPWLGWKEPPRSSVLLSPPRTVAWISSVRFSTRHLHPLHEHLQGRGVYYLPTQPLPSDCSDYSVSSIHEIFL